VSLVEQELPTLPEHLSSPPVFSGARVTRSLVLYVCFVDRCLSFCTFSVGHCEIYLILSYDILTVPCENLIVQVQSEVKEIWE
jgi:hypothetical protein